ncbi:MAG: hypothetical protein ABIE70_12220 [bacterium]
MGVSRDKAVEDWISSEILHSTDLPIVVIEREFKEMHTSFNERIASGVTRVETAAQSLAGTIGETTNNIVANIGYLDDKLKGRPPSQILQ